MSIKSEPISPSHRESATPSSIQHMRPPSTGHPGHLSPSRISNTGSNASSPTGSTHSHNDFDGPNAKRSRISSEGWSS